MYPVKQSTAITIPMFAHDINGDAVTDIVNASWTKRISKNGGAFAAMTVTITEMEGGWYSLPLSTSHTDTLGDLTMYFTASGAKQVNLKFRVHAQLPDDIAADVWDEVLTGATHNIANSAGRRLRQLQPNDTSLHSGTAQAGGANTITLDVGASSVDDFYNNTFVTTTGGTGAGQARLITDYVGSTKVATVDSNWSTNPDLTTTFDILPLGTVEVASIRDPAIDEIWDEVIDAATSVPAATPSVRSFFGWLVALFRNKRTTTSTLETVTNDAGTAIATSVLSDDNTTFTRNEYT